MKFLRGKTHVVNVSTPERIGAGILGVAMAAYGIKRRSIGGALLAIAGADAIYTSLSGVCHVYKAFGINTAEAKLPFINTVRHNVGLKFERTVTIFKSPDFVFNFWRNFENLPRFMKHLESVKILGPTTSHWVAKGPAGTRVEWDAEVYAEIPNEKIAWRSTGEADVNNAGTVEFKPAFGGKATEVKVVLSYEPPAGKIGVAIAKLFGEEPEQQVREDLRRFKQLLETGEIPTTEGQPTGRRPGFRKTRKARKERNAFGIETQDDVFTEPRGEQI